MTRDVIEEIAYEADLPIPLVEYVFSRSGVYLKNVLRHTSISRILIRNLGVWRVNLTNVNNIIYYTLLPYLKMARNPKLVTKESRERAEKKFKHLWKLRQNCIKYKKQRNAKYYESRHK